MSNLKRPRVLLRLIGISCLLPCPGIGCSSQGLPGGNGRQTAGGPFEEDEFWIIGTDSSADQEATLTLGGFGDTIELAMASINTDSESTAACVANQPDGTVEFDGQTLRIESSFVGEGTDDACSIDLTGSVTSCTDRLLPAGTSCILTTEGVAMVAGEESPVSALQLTRPGRCDGMRGFGASEWWRLTNVHSLLAGTMFSPPYDLTQMYDLHIVILGIGDVLDGGEVFLRTGLEEGESEIRFSGRQNEGGSITVSFDGQEFSIEAQLDLSDGNTNGVPGSEGFSMSFTGTATYCWEPGLFAPLEEGSRALRIDGTGSYTAAGREGELTVFYLDLTGLDLGQAPEP